MAEILCRTKENSDPKGKPRVYFTCHPKDWKYFNKICEDIFATQDCAIYYTKDMEGKISRQDRETDLGSQNLFVVPVTFRLLNEPNRAMDEDISYAMEKKIPILPFMMEQNILEYYTQKFGERQYLNPFSGNRTEISYKEKLKKYLESVLISDETVRKIQKAFDAYIFLSYRRKDRRYANKLMKLIHSYPEFRDVAIWYDEFLIPGESFKKNITRALKKSRLFALLVTPHLLEESNGKPNYVVREEYPAARKAGKVILPAQMKKTDYGQLATKFEGIPSCVKPGSEEFRKQLFSALTRCNQRKKGPMHEYLIGLAYLEGIDVETNRELGMELISAAAESGLPEAMEKLYNIYCNEACYQQALQWARQSAEYYENRYGEKDPNTLKWVGSMAHTYDMQGDYTKAIEQQERLQTLLSEAVGREHPDTLMAKAELARIYVKMERSVYSNTAGVGVWQLSAGMMMGEVYEAQKRVLGQEHPDTLRTLSEKAMITSKGTLSLQYPLQDAQMAYTLQCKVLGEAHPDTLATLQTLAQICTEAGKYEQALKLCRKVYNLRNKLFGKRHPDTLDSLNRLVLAYEKLCRYEQALKLAERAYLCACTVLGEEHPDTLETMERLMRLYNRTENYRKALEWGEGVYILQCKRYNPWYPKAKAFWNVLDDTDAKAHPQRQLQELPERMYALCCQVMGEENPNTVLPLIQLAKLYDSQENYAKAMPLWEKIYTLQCSALGEEDWETMESMESMAQNYRQLGEYQKALALFEKQAVLREKVSGKIDDNVLYHVADTYRLMGERENALEWYEKVFDSVCRQDLLMMWCPALVAAYEQMGEYRRVLKVQEAVYEYWLRQLGENNIGLVAPLNNMAATYDLLEDYEKAKQLRQQAKETERRAYAHEQIKQLEEKINATYGTDKIPERVELLKQLYTLQCENWGTSHWDSRITLIKLVWDCCDLGHYQEAAGLCEKLYEAECEAEGEESPDTDTAVGNLVYLYGKLEDDRMAQKWARRLYILRQKRLGKEHPDTVSAGKNLQRIWQRLGLCRSCGSEFTVENICSRCGRPKNY